MSAQPQSALAQTAPAADSEIASTDVQSGDKQQLLEGSIHGTVEDTNGNALVGAQVTLVTELTQVQETYATDLTGYFNFVGLQSGGFRITVKAQGFAEAPGTEIALPPGKDYEVPTIVLHIAPASADVHVVFTRHEMAEEQLRNQEKQRIFGVVPNFYATYIWNAAPLTPRQKFQLAWRSSIDPVTFLLTGAFAGVEQAQNDFPGYGQGGAGYGKRFGASYADSFSGAMIGGALLPSILHQDPRYFYKGTGSIRSRAFYAIATVAICKGDNGHWQPNYSNVLGSIASAGISNLYYPASNRHGAGVTIDNALIGAASGAVQALLQEFLLRKVSRGVKQAPAASPNP